MYEEKNPSKNDAVEEIEDFDEEEELPPSSSKSDQQEPLPPNSEALSSSFAPLVKNAEESSLLEEKTKRLRNCALKEILTSGLLLFFSFQRTRVYRFIYRHR